MTSSVAVYSIMNYCPIYCNDVFPVANLCTTCKHITHRSMGTVPWCLSEFVVYCLDVFAAFSGVSQSKSLLVCITPGSDGNVSTAWPTSTCHLHLLVGSHQQYATLTRPNRAKQLSADTIFCMGWLRGDRAPGRGSFSPVATLKLCS